MNRPRIASTVFGLLLAGTVAHLAAASLPSQPKRQEITPNPAGPFHGSGNRIVDSHGRPFLLRGTQLTDFNPQTIERDNRAGDDYGPHSATSLSAIRLRFNMNAVRLPVNVLDSNAPGYFSKLAQVVRRANQVDLLVVLAAREPGAALPSQRTAEFWTRCADYFKDDPNVFFDVFSDPSPSALPANAVDPHSAAGWNLWRVRMQSLVRAIRATGATQPIVVPAWKDDRLFEGADTTALIDDPDIIYEAPARFANIRSDRERDAHFGLLARSAPVIASGWDLELNDAAACSAVPSDPSAATAFIQANLDYFDARQISWIGSVFSPGKLVTDFSLIDATSLDNGWTCGASAAKPAGIGLILEGHLRSSVQRGLFVVSGSGSPDVARGGLALAYGPIMAAFDAKPIGSPASLSLGRISIQITDALGATRPAGMLWASAGWGQTNFVIPQDSAIGPAVMTIVRQDGSRASSNITIADTAPGFLTGLSCRGPALGSATAISRDGRTSTTTISSCKGIHCDALPIPVASGAPTTVRLLASGFRHAASAEDIDVNISGIRVPVVSYGPDQAPGLDFLTIQIPASLRGFGETDLVAHINGRVSNAVRINFGGEKPAL